MSSLVEGEGRPPIKAWNPNLQVAQVDIRLPIAGAPQTAPMSRATHKGVVGPSLPTNSSSCCLCLPAQSKPQLAWTKRSFEDAQAAEVKHASYVVKGICWRAWLQGTYTIKFVVDGQWRCAPGWPIEASEKGDNNVLQVDPLP